MSKLVRLDEECEEILRKYSEGSLSDCVRAMEATKTKVINASPDVEGIVRKVVKEEIDRRMNKLELGIQGTMNNFMQFVAHGQSPAVKDPIGQVVRDDSYNFNMSTPMKYGFVRASEYKKEG